MDLTTKSIFLTLVLVFMGSVGFAQDKVAEPEKTNDEAKKPVDSAKKKRELQKEREEAKANLDTCRDKKDADCSGLTKIYNEKNNAFIDFDAQSSTSKEQCDSTFSEINTLRKDFGAAAQEEALACMEAGVGNSAEDTLDLTGAVLRGLTGQRDSRQSACAVESAKSSQAEKLKEKITALEKLERDLEKLEEKIIERENKSNNELADLNDDRVKLREDWEKKQADQEEQKAKEAAGVRDNQIKLQEAIRKASAELIAARQDFAKAKRKRNDDLLKAGVQSFSSMQRICKAQVKEYFSKAGYNTKKKSKSLGASSKSGGDKVSDVNSFYSDCLKSMNERRQAIYEDSSNYEIQMANNLKDRQLAIETLEGEYKQQTVNYNQALERDAASLTKAQQAYQQNDSNLALKINQLQISAEKERQNFDSQKKLLLQKIQAAELSNGKIRESEVVDGVENMERYMGLVESLSTGGCPQASIFNSERAKFEKNRKRIKEVKAQD